MEDPAALAQKRRPQTRKASSSSLETQQAQADVGIATRSPNQMARNEHDDDALEDDAISKNILNKINRKRAATTTTTHNSNYISSPPPPKFSRTEIGELIIVEPEQSRGSSSSAHSASMEKSNLQPNKNRKTPRYNNNHSAQEAMDLNVSLLEVKPPARLHSVSRDDTTAPSFSAQHKASSHGQEAGATSLSSCSAGPLSPEDLERKEQEILDLAVALSLQEQFNKAALVSTSQGRAWDFVHKIAANHQRLCEYNPEKPDWNGNNFKVVRTDDLVFCVARLLDTQAEFRAANKDCKISIGYHYTAAANMERIRQDGLLTKAERDASGIQTPNHGASFGDGVYLGNNPYSYHKFCGGDQGLLVARLKGSLEEPNPDTVLGRKGESDEVCVLQKSSQCVALVQYHADVVSITEDTAIGNEMVYAYHCNLQAIVDECFNDNTETDVPKLLPSQVILRAHSSQTTVTFPLRDPGRVNFVSLEKYEAPETLADKTLAEEVVDVSVPNEQQCHICLDSMTATTTGSSPSKACAKLKHCSHHFHRACVEECLQHSRKCPVCRSAIGVDAVQGTMPSGTMKIVGAAFLDCSGYSKLGSIKITYEMDGGTQKPYHVNPGVKFDGTVRIAYIPDVEEGRALLKRLKWAFNHGLTFTIGTSLSTGKSNRIVWASIHHKTSTSPGPHGFPDAGYFINANEELDALHVPPSDQL